MKKEKTPFEKYIKKVFKIHDKEVNQKYADKLPYSFHVGAAMSQGKLFLNLLETKERILVQWALPIHDTGEDARMTYNDNRALVLKYAKNCQNVVKYFPDVEDFATQVADIAFAVEDEKGKTRAERKNEKYYRELNETELGVYVKLSDLSANMLFSKLTVSGMYNKYKSRDFPKMKEKVYKERFEPFFNYVENL